MYAIDCSDPGLRLFINEYIKAGGSKDLICYNGYFSRTNNMKRLDTISIQDLILNKNKKSLLFIHQKKQHYIKEWLMLYQIIKIKFKYNSIEH